MKILPVIVAALAMSACSHHRNEQVVQHESQPPQQDTTATEPTEVEMIVAVPDEEDMTSTEPSEVVVPAALDHLREVIDVTMQTEPKLGDEQVAQALNAIADALAAMPQPNIASIDSIRTNAATVRNMQGRSRRDSRAVRRALDEAMLSLRTIQGASEEADVDRAAAAVKDVSPARPVTQQVAVIRDALCAVGSAVSVAAETGRYGCIEHTSGTAQKEQ
jgi:hypothetical protein